MNFKLNQIALLSALTAGLVGCGGSDGGGGDTPPPVDVKPEHSFTFNQPEVIDAESGSYSNLLVDGQEGVAGLIWSRSGQVFTKIASLGSEAPSKVERMTQGYFDSFIPENGHLENKSVSSLDTMVTFDGTPCSAWVDRGMVNGNEGQFHTLDLFYSCFDINGQEWSEPKSLKHIKLVEDVNLNPIRDVRLHNLKDNSQLVTWRNDDVASYSTELAMYKNHSFLGTVMEDGQIHKSINKALIARDQNGFTPSVVGYDDTRGLPIVYWLDSVGGKDELKMTTFTNGFNRTATLPTSDTDKYALSLTGNGRYLTYSQSARGGNWSLSGLDLETLNPLSFSALKGQAQGFTAKGTGGEVVGAWIEMTDKENSAFDSYAVKMNTLKDGKKVYAKTIASGLDGVSNLSLEKLDGRYAISWVERLKSDSSVVKMVEYADGEWTDQKSFKCGSTCDAYDAMTVKTTYGESEAIMVFTKGKSVQQSKGFRI